MNQTPDRLGIPYESVLTRFGISWRLAAKIIRPLRRLERATHAFGQGRSARVPVESNDEVGRLAQSYNIMVDAVEQREQLILAAMHDPLTQLPNRRLFLQHMDKALAELHPAVMGVLILIDVDDFKNVNDTLGHPAGDALLRELGARLGATFDDATTGRLGGDEFAIMLPAVPLGADLTAIGRKVLSCFSQKVRVGDDIVSPSGSIGVAVATANGVGGVKLMKHADLALYAAKESGKGCFHLFDAVLEERWNQQQTVEHSLRYAVAKKELRLEFQPIYSLEDDRLSGFEALTRWRGPGGKEICPGTFIPIAEKSGVINALGEWALDEACSQAVRWEPNLSIAVNVSPIQLRNPGFVETTANTLVRHGLSPRRLTIEITESVFVSNLTTALHSLRHLRAMGVRVALDDFGTGYSSLNFLRSFPFDRVKIDQTFVRNLKVAEHDPIVRAIIALAKALNMETVAEGVETIDQLEALRAEGCSQVQGYLLGRPMAGCLLPDIVGVFQATNLGKESVRQIQVNRAGSAGGVGV